MSGEIHLYHVYHLYPNPGKNGEKEISIPSHPGECT